MLLKWLLMANFFFHYFLLFQIPGYSKEEFSIVTETMHYSDKGTSFNVIFLFLKLKGIIISILVTTGT